MEEQQGRVEKIAYAYTVRSYERQSHQLQQPEMFAGPYTYNVARIKFVSASQRVGTVNTIDACHKNFYKKK